MGTTERRGASYLLTLVIMFAGTAGCDLWPLDHPLDPRQCDPACSSGKRCSQGTCISADAMLSDAQLLCGNGTVDPYEVCDRARKVIKTCKDSGFDGGELKCASDCRAFDLGGCWGCSTDWCTLPKGTFSMGSPSAEPCREPDKNISETRHQVTLTHRFQVQRTEATQIQYVIRIYNDPSSFAGCADCPVESLTWDMAANYCNVLTLSGGGTQCYSCALVGKDKETECEVLPEYAGAKIYDCRGYRLPTEAEWEYAYRAGTQTAYHSGTNDATRCDEDSKPDAKLAKIGWYRANASRRPQPVGKKQPNAWGLLDMAGNVREWCHDKLLPDLGGKAVSDPVGTSTALDRVIRGGSWDSTPKHLRAAARQALSGGTDSTLGVRCVRTLDP